VRIINFQDIEHRIAVLRKTIIAISSINDDPLTIELIKKDGTVILTDRPNLLKIYEETEKLGAGYLKPLTSAKANNAIELALELTAEYFDKLDFILKKINY